MLILTATKDSVKKMLKCLKLSYLLLNFFLLASKLCNNDFENFWKDIKHMNNDRLLNPSNVGGASGVENVNMWLHYYQSLLNSIPGSPANTKTIYEYCNVQFNTAMYSLMIK